MQLSKKLYVHQKQISGYERGIHAPSIELLIKMEELYVEVELKLKMTNT